MNEGNGEGLVELFQQFPHEAGLALLKTLELGALCSTILVSHCALLCARAYLQWRAGAAPASRLDCILFSAGMLRVLLFLPRPRIWWRLRKQYQAARLQPTPHQVARSLVRLYAQPQGAEAGLLYFFYFWLAALGLLLWRGGLPPTVFSAAFCSHLQANVVALILVRLASVAMFLWLQRLDFSRGVPAELLEAFSTIGVYTGAAGAEDCAICYDAFAPGERTRTLRCRHAYHAACVDKWLLKKKNCCPLCQRAVGPEEEEDEGKREKRD